MPKYVIHLGPSKTGARRLQNALFGARELLRAAGIDYPDIWWTLPDQVTHGPLWQLLREGRYAEVREAFGKLNSDGARIVVLSCEDFAELTAGQFVALRDAIGNNPVELVYYCRRWTERIPLEWKQSVHLGSFATLPEYYLDYLRDASQSGAVNYSLIWAAIIHVFGRKSLKLVSYSNLRDQGVDLIRHFARSFLDWDGELAVRREPLPDQSTASTPEMEILRALNWIDHQATGRHRPDMHFRFSRMRSGLDTSLLERLMAADLGTLELSDGVAGLRSSWKEINKYADCLVPRTFFRARPFELRAASVAYVRGNYLLTDGAIGELQSLYDRLDSAAGDVPGLA